MNVLHALDGPLAGSSYPLKASIVIGRDGDSDVQLLDEDVSRRHACIVENEDGSVSVLDLGSVNGTTVDGKPVGEARVRVGAKIGVGATTFELRDVDSADVDMDVPDIKLTSGPAIEATLAGEGAVLLSEVRERLRAAARESASLCCDDPLAVRARDEGWAHCPACGHATG